MFKLAVFNIQHLNSMHSHRQVLSQVPACNRIKSIVHRGINPPQKHPSCFFPSPLQIVGAPHFSNSPYILFFCDTPTPLKIG